MYVDYLAFFNQRLYNVVSKAKNNDKIIKIKMIITCKKPPLLARDAFPVDRAAYYGRRKKISCAQEI